MFPCSSDSADTGARFNGALSGNLRAATRWTSVCKGDSGPNLQILPSQTFEGPERSTKAPPVDVAKAIARV